MELVVLWIVGAVIVGIIAGSRGRVGFGWFMLSLLFSPLLMGILVLALGRPGPVVGAISAETHTRCLDCKEVVRRDARKCKHCGAVLTPS